jgi:phosphocarrier protein FPr
MGFFNTFFSKPLSTSLTVTSQNGFHLRPVAKFVSVAKKYNCDVSASFNGKQVDAKGVNTLLSLSLEENDTFLLTCKGSDAKNALNTLQNTFNTLMQDDKAVESIQKEQNTTYDAEILEGEIVSLGIAIAKVHHYKEQSIQKESSLSFEEAINRSLDELETLYAKYKKSEDATIYLAQKELLFSLKKEISTLEELKNSVRNASKELRGSKLEAKIDDYRDILQRVKKHLGYEVKELFPTTPFILVAKDLLPSQIEKLLKTSVKGVILQETSINSHTAILLRSSGIVSLIANGSLLAENEEIILDANSAVIVKSPSSNDLKKAKEQLETNKQKEAVAFTKRFEVAKTKSGKNIKVFANVTDENSAKEAKEEGADGIGLLRTEFLFKEQKPSLQMQVDSYERIFSYFSNITLRTLDVGGDKALPYINIKKEDNPFLGIRGVRLFKSHPKIMEEQLHAVFLAAKNRSIKIMFPMVSSVEEFNEAKTFAKSVAKKHQIDISNILFGIMVEVPSVLFLIDSFNEVVDFYSIGTNDLTQYLFAIERTHPTLKIDELSPVVFSAIEMILKYSTKPVSICGELAANQKAIEKLLELGIETLSVSAKSVAKSKEEIRNV